METALASQLDRRVCTWTASHRPLARDPELVPQFPYMPSLVPCTQWALTRARLCGQSRGGPGSSPALGGSLTRKTLPGRPEPDLPGCGGRSHGRPVLSGQARGAGELRSAGTETLVSDTKAASRSGNLGRSPSRGSSNKTSEEAALPGDVTGRRPIVGRLPVPEVTYGADGLLWTIRTVGRPGACESAYSLVSRRPGCKRFLRRRAGLPRVGSRPWAGHRSDRWANAVEETNYRVLVDKDRSVF